MYEVFLNDRKIIIAGEDEQPLVYTQANRELISDQHSFLRKIMGFLAGENDEIIVVGDLSQSWQNFQRIFRLLPAAGGIVHKNKEFLFIYRRGKWDLPKGKIDRDESPEEAALREVTEETGLTDLFIERFYTSTWHIYQSYYKGTEGVWILKETKWYSMRYTGDGPLIPETGEDIEEVRWIPQEGLNEVLANTYSSLKELIISLGVNK
jgi:8-oxo-dGTP pyrophosphatase MutT (NUDIX family)